MYDDEASELAKAVAGILGEAGSKPLSMNGIIDLAVLKDGVWIIVDYKTDIIRTDENEAAYLNRLKEQYTNQLRCYTDVVSRMGCGEVEKLYICAVNLGGKLISIDK